MASDGTRGAWLYRQGCRCSVCRAANAEASRLYRARLRDRDPTRHAEASAASAQRGKRSRARRAEREQFDQLGPPTICRVWDCERRPLSNGYCRVHSP